MADEPKMTMPNEDNAQPIDAASMTSVTSVAVDQLRSTESASTQENEVSLQAYQFIASEDPQVQDHSETEHAEPPVAESPEWIDDSDAESALQWMSAPDDELTSPMPTATAKLPEVIETPEYIYPAPEDEPQLRDVGTTLARWLRGRARAAASFVSAHRILLSLAFLLCVGVVLAAVLFGMDATNVPSDELIRQDAKERLAPPTYTAGNYAEGEPLVLQSVEIEHKGNSGSQRSGFEVDVKATFTNAGMETQADGMLTYEREGDEWKCIEATVGKVSHHATAGVSQKRVLEQAFALLQAADTADGTEPLSALYKDATVEVTPGKFNEGEQTDSLNLHYSSNGTFVSYECNLSVNFRFVPASGAWELAGAIVSDGARDLGFGPLIGTWTGTFDSQKSSSAKCLAARDAGLTIEITHAAMTDDGNAMIKGNLSGVAHLHANLETDANATEGDSELEAIPFTGKLLSGNAEQDISLLVGSNPEYNHAGIVFDCTTQDLAGGKVSLLLEFGQASAPEAASATLTTTCEYEDTFLLVMSYKREASFADTFTLEKSI